MARNNDMGVPNRRRKIPHDPASKAPREKWTVVDLFSGVGGTAVGFHKSGRFRILGAVDLEVGKPSQRNGLLDCNATYKSNIWRSATLSERMPPPTGVVSGPLMPTK